MIIIIISYDFCLPINTRDLNPKYYLSKLSRFCHVYSLLPLSSQVNVPWPLQKFGPSSLLVGKSFGGVVEKRREATSTTVAA